LQPNDGGRRNPTLGLFLTNGQSTLELDLADAAASDRGREWTTGMKSRVRSCFRISPTNPARQLLTFGGHIGLRSSGRSKFE